MAGPADSDRRALVEGAFRAHGEVLFHHLFRLLGDEAEAESMTQECFLRLCASDASFPHDGALRAWLFRVARNLVFDRSKRRRPRLLDPDGPTRLEQEEDPGAEPSGLAERGESLERLRRALASLPVLYQHTLRLRFLEHWSYEELAEAEGVTESALRTRIHKGLQLLRAELERGSGLPPRTGPAGTR